MQSGCAVLTIGGAVMSNGWVKVPNGLVSAVSPTTLAVWVAIAEYANRVGIAWPGQGSIAQKVGVTDRTVRRAITELEAIGALDVERRGRQKTNSYIVHWGWSPGEGSGNNDAEILASGTDRTSRSDTTGDRTVVSTSDRSPVSDKPDPDEQDPDQSLEPDPEAVYPPVSPHLEPESISSVHRDPDFERGVTLLQTWREKRKVVTG